MNGRFLGFIRGNAIGLIALFVALGGTTYAATALPRNSVGSSQVINGSLKKADLSGKAVSALKGNKGTQGTPGPQGARGATGPAGTRGSKGATGAKGPTGLQGVQGVQGVQGIAGPTNAYTNYGTLTSISVGTTQTVSSVTLPAGRYTLSGQVRFSEGNADGQETALACNYISAGTVHQSSSYGAYGVTNPTRTMPVIGDATLTFPASIFLRCNSVLKTALVVGSMIATRVETISPSS
jgi:collagen triple helix repeat protein